MAVILKGRLMGLYRSPNFTNRETGEVVQGKTKVQIMAENVLKNGEKKMELFDISIPPEKASALHEKVNKEIEVEVGYFGNTTFFGI